jgi:hypothetical protein
MRTKFYFRETKTKKTIYFEYRNEITRFRGSTPFKLKNIADWDEKKCKLKIPSTISNASNINEKLDSILNKFEKHLMENNNFDNITNNECRIIYDSIQNELFGKQIKETQAPIIVTSYNVISYFEHYIEHFTKSPSQSTRKLIKKNSMKGYTSSKKVIENYMTEKNIKKLNFDDINRNFYVDFYEYLLDENYSLNYIGTIIQKLKTIMKSSFDFDYHNNLEFQKSYFSKVNEAINHPYLNLEELELISNLALEDEQDENIRDVFIIQCNSGMRIQDLLDFIKNPEFVNVNNKAILLHKEQGKTNTDVYAPLNKQIQKILDKRNGELPKYIHQNKINKRIKEICRKANIITPFTIKRTEGRERKTFTKPKCEFIATHTARRSFCTNAYMAGIPPHLIMLISGHKTEKTFMLYIKAELKLKASKFSDYEYFQ